MDVQEVARRAGLAPRAVRYVLDHRVLPGGGRPAVIPDRPGRPRSLTDLEAYFAAAATLLLAGGVRRDVATRAFAALAAAPWPPPGPPPTPSPLQRATGAPRTALDAVYSWAGEAAALEIGDGAYLRLVLGEVDTGWRAAPGFAPLAPGHRPRVVVRLDLAALRAAFE